MPELETIIGLEVHAQMNTKTKMFCRCSCDSFGKPPNSTVCPICMGHPGTLPTPNRDAFLKAIQAALALNCTVSEHSHFDRKHYFYPDLPKGFQISQYDFPLARHGHLEFDSKKCRIHRLHIEDDAGKLIHPSRRPSLRSGLLRTGRGKTTLCDYNRAGTPLMEIVTEPDLRSPNEAVAFAQELRRILIVVDASEADMFKGMMRFDASISLRVKGDTTLNPRSEIKNLNSFKALEKALLYEEARLQRLWEEEHGPMKHNITVGWLDDEGATRVLRAKETAEDYRYFPEPDIPPLEVSRELLEELRATLPLLPQEIRKKYLALGLPDAEAQTLIDQPPLRELFDVVHTKMQDPKKASSIVLTQLLGFLNAHGKSVEEGPKPKDLLELFSFIDKGTISANAAKEVLEEMVVSGKSASAIIAQRGMQQISDDAMLEELVRKALTANPDAVSSFKKGKHQALGAIIGWVMKETKGQANPVKVNEILLRHL